MSTAEQRRKWREKSKRLSREKHERIEAARSAVREALDAMNGVGEALLELMRTRGKDCCAICGRKSKRAVCARADCATEYERLYQADRRERRRALRGNR